jgi:fructosamine-3-kinase
MTGPLIEAIIGKSLGSESVVQGHRAVGGGCINQCFQVETHSTTYFLKLNKVGYLDMFQAEYQGLETLAKACDMLVPHPIDCGKVEQVSYLLMEYIKPGSRRQDYWEKLAEGLASLHRVTDSQFGWESDNYIGRLPQSNKRHSQWVEFFVAERLLPQMNLAVGANLLPNRAKSDLENLCHMLDQLLVKEEPALLHGDLWSGNIMVGINGEPGIVDPAVYYGHREIELAFTTLFGGFDPRFYQAYQSVCPLEKGYQDRFDIYNLYPLLVHLNLFGTSYLGDIIRIARKFV